MYGPNDSLGASGYNTGCASVIVVLIICCAGLWMAL